MILTKLDQHVNEMMTTTGKKFQNFLWSRFLIIVQTVNMVTNGKCNCRLIPVAYMVNSRLEGDMGNLWYIVFELNNMSIFKALTENMCDGQGDTHNGSVIIKPRMGTFLGVFFTAVLQ